MKVATRLDMALKAAQIPIVGVSIGREDDKRTWRVDFMDEASAAQKVAAEKIIKSIDPNAADVPMQVTIYQGRAALINAGLFDRVKTAVDNLGHASLAYQAFEYANHWHRDSPFIAQLAAALGLTDAEVDELFIAAAQM